MIEISNKLQRNTFYMASHYLAFYAISILMLYKKEYVE